MKRLLTLIVMVISILLIVGPACAFNEIDLQYLKMRNRCPGCDLYKAPLSGANLNAANLTNAILNDADLSGANLSCSRLQGATLRGANLTGANLSYALSEGGNFSGANLTGANMTHTYLDGADLSNATWTDGTKCKEGSKSCCVDPNARDPRFGCKR